MPVEGKGPSEKDKDTEVHRFPDKEEGLNRQIADLNGVLIELLGARDGIERKLSSVIMGINSLEKEGKTDTPKSISLTERRDALIQKGIDIKIKIRETEQQIKNKENQLTSLIEERESRR